jgi:enoyl-CoA hydratase/carnithine racemase
MGEYLALTGHTIGRADAVAAGLADGYMPSRSLPDHACGAWRPFESQRAIEHRLLQVSQL